MKPAAQRYEREPHRSKPTPQYQLEMGTKSLLAAFFALAVVCGLFFAFGYTIGKHAVPATFSLGAAKPLPARNTTERIAPGVQPPNPQQLGAAETNQTPAVLTPPQAGASGTDSPAPTSTSTSSGSSPAPPAAQPAVTNAAPAKPLPAAAAGAASGGASQLYEVQVFAGTSADAGSLADALKTRGYPSSVVAPAPGSGNKLYRVEVGPYLTRAEAQAMRARLRADGYQAVLRIGQ